MTPRVKRVGHLFCKDLCKDSVTHAIVLSCSGASVIFYTWSKRLLSYHSSSLLLFLFCAEVQFHVFICKKNYSISNSNFQFQFPITTPTTKIWPPREKPSMLVVGIPNKASLYIRCQLQCHEMIHVYREPVVYTVRWMARTRLYR